MLENDSDEAHCNRSLLTEFIQQEMKLPFQMHSVHRQLFMAVLKHQSKSMSLETMLQIIFEVMQRQILPPWLAFAADTAEMYVLRGGHFVEKSDQAGRHFPRQNMSEE